MAHSHLHEHHCESCSHEHEHHHEHEAHEHHHKHESHEHHHEHSLKKQLWLIIITVVLLIIAVLIECSSNGQCSIFNVQLSKWQLLLVYLVPYLIIGHETLHEAWEGIVHGDVFTVVGTLHLIEQIDGLAVVDTYAGESVSRIKYLEKEFITLVAIFSEKGGEVFKSGCLNLAIAESDEDRTDCIEYIISLGHLFLREITSSLWYGRFLN